MQPAPPRDRWELLKTHLRHVVVDDELLSNRDHRAILDDVEARPGSHPQILPIIRRRCEGQLVLNPLVPELHTVLARTLAIQAVAEPYPSSERLHQQALEHYELALSLGDNHGAWDAGYARALLWKATWVSHRQAISLIEKAVYHSQRALDLDPSYCRALCTRGVSYARQAALLPPSEAKAKLEAAFVDFDSVLKIAPQDFRTLTAFGHALVDAQQFDSAAIKFQEALKIHAGNHHAWNGWGNALRGQAALLLAPQAHAKLTEAMLKYERACVLRPDYFVGLTGLGLALLDKAKLQLPSAALETCDTALSLFAQAVSVCPEYHLALIHSASTLLLKARTSGKQAAVECIGQALDRLRLAEQARPEDPLTLVQTADALAFQSSISSGAEVHRLATASIEKCQAALAIRPNWPQAHRTWAYALRLRADHNEPVTALHLLSEAEAHCQTAYELAPGDPFTIEVWADTLRFSARSAVGKERLPGAVTKYRQALELRPNRLAAHVGLGDALRRLGQFEEAIVASAGALSQLPEFPPALEHWAAILRQQHKLAEALEKAQQAEQSFPENASILTLHGAILADLGRKEEAAARFQAALSLDPGFYWAFVEWADLERNTAESVQIPPSARELLLTSADVRYGQAVALRPELPNAHKGLAACLIARARLDGPTQAASLLERASQELRKAIRLGADDAPTKAMLAKISATRGQWIPIQGATAQPFEISRYPVTVSRYAEYVEATKATSPLFWRDQSLHPNHPVVGVSWDEAKSFCVWSKSRLPTEAEWEAAALGEELRKYPWGSELPTTEHANYRSSGLNNTTSVGQHHRGATPEGVEDMAGNVWEWVADSPRTRVARGGSFRSEDHALRSTHRGYFDPVLRWDHVGFRCARDSEKPTFEDGPKPLSSREFPAKSRPG